MELCDCRRAPALCDRCVDASFANLRGVAGCRGQLWAERVWKVTRQRDVWTTNALNARTRALQLVADLGADRRLRERLVDAVIAEAAHRWTQLLEPQGAKLLPWR